MTKTKMSPFFIDFAFKSEKKPCGKPSQVGYERCQLLWRQLQRHSIAATDFPLALLVWNSMTPRPRMAQVYHYVHSTLTTCLWHLAAISWNALIHAFVTRQFSMYLYAVVSHGHKFIIIVESLFLQQSNCWISWCKQLIKWRVANKSATPISTKTPLSSASVPKLSPAAYSFITITDKKLECINEVQSDSF